MAKGGRRHCTCEDQGGCNSYALGSAPYIVASKCNVLFPIVPITATVIIEILPMSCFANALLHKLHSAHAEPGTCQGRCLSHPIADACNTCCNLGSLMRFVGGHLLPGSKCRVQGAVQQAHEAALHLAPVLLACSGVLDPSLQCAGCCH